MQYSTITRSFPNHTELLYRDVPVGIDLGTEIIEMMKMKGEEESRHKQCVGQKSCRSLE